MDAWRSEEAAALMICAGNEDAQRAITDITQLETRASVESENVFRC